MFHAGRCGSTVLGRMLEARRDMVWAGELLMNIRRDEPERTDRAPVVARRVRRWRDAHLTPYFGFETKFLPQLDLRPTHANLELPAYLDLLRSLGFDRFVVLQRRNLLRRAVSVEVARQRKQWHTQEASREATRIHLNVDAFQTGNETEPLIRLFERIDAQYELIRGLLAEEPLTWLTYEDDILPDPRIGYRRVCEMLELDPGQTSVDLKRTNPYPLDEQVENITAVAAALRGSPYEWMLDD